MQKSSWGLLLVAIVGLATLTYVKSLRPIIAAFLVLLLLYGYKRI
jgi:hypothetical protein